MVAMKKKCSFLIEGGVQSLALSNGVDLSILPQKNLLSSSLKGPINHGRDR
jgi:hypothetical protein